MEYIPSENKKILNTSKIINEIENQKIFLGEYSGFQRYDQYKYPFAKNLEEKMRNAFWNPNEISMVNDSQKFPELPQHIQDIMIRIWLFQTVMDSGQNRGMDNITSTITTLPEFEALFKTHGYFELIHSLSYSHILRGIFSDSTEIFNQIEQYDEIKNRINDEIEGYDRVRIISQDIIKSTTELIEYISEYADEDEKKELQEAKDKIVKITANIFNKKLSKINEDKKKEILSLMIRILALEGVKFYVSFLATYLINNAYNNKIQGATRIIKLINFDEDFHTSVMAGTIQLLKKNQSEGMSDLINSKWFEETVKEVFLKVYNDEIEWAKYLLSFGPIPGMTLPIIESFMKFYVDDRVSSIGVNKIFNEPKTDIVTWFQNYKDMSLDNVAQQESDLKIYSIGILKNDIPNGVISIKGI